jgi:hypothetical protein
MKKKIRWRGIGGRKEKKWKDELKKPIPINLMNKCTCNIEKSWCEFHDIPGGKN